MKMRVALFTAAFPHYPGEQFLEEEMAVWDQFGEKVDVDIFPYALNGIPRDIPSSFRIDGTFSNGSRWFRLIAVFFALVTPLFWKEALASGLPKSGGLWRAVDVLRSVAAYHAFLFRVRLNKHLGGYDVAYFYWSDDRSLAGEFLRRTGFAKRVVSRAHGADLYEERRRGGYMPLKRRFNRAHDRLYLLSESAKQYALSRYAYSPPSLGVAPLGVNIPEGLAAPSNDEFHILSVSFCVPVKRLSLLIDAIRQVAEARPVARFRWTHIGGGPLHEQIKELARMTLSAHENLRYDLPGTITTDQVRQFYECGHIDLFLNVSQSEGMPVSIMEAMSYGVPVIAPDVGGVQHMLDDSTGMLLPAGCSAEEVAESILAMQSMHLSSNYQRLRERARSRAIERFDARKNYRAFIEEVLAPRPD